MMFFSVLIFLLVITCGYLLGSIPTAAWIASIKGFDITQHGSGNSGATNIGRILGVQYFIIVFLLDSAKSFFFLFFLQWLQIPLWYQIAGAMMLLYGNSFSPFLQGRGGKGISTSVGIVIALMPQLLVFLVPFWFCVVLLIRTVGIASVMAVLLLPIVALFHAYSHELLLLCFFISAWCLMKHASNIKRFIGLELS